MRPCLHLYCGVPVPMRRACSVPRLHAALLSLRVAAAGGTGPGGGDAVGGGTVHERLTVWCRGQSTPPSGNGPRRRSCRR